MGDLLPAPLVEAAHVVRTRLEQASSLMDVAVTAIGFNTHVKLWSNDLGVDGRTFCMWFAPSPETVPYLLGQDMGARDIEVFGRMRCRHGPLLYSIRVEPDHESDGQNVYVAINGHQEVTSEGLEVTLEAASSFRDTISVMLSRLRSITQ